MTLSKDPVKRAHQLANLRAPWKPGEPGNPGGQRKPKDLMACVMMRLTQDDLEKSADAFIEMLREGSLVHQRELMDRTIGRAIARNENGDPGDFSRHVVIEFETVRREHTAS
jgi:hypothetical protein